MFLHNGLSSGRDGEYSTAADPSSTLEIWPQALQLSQCTGRDIGFDWTSKQLSQALRDAVEAAKQATYLALLHQGRQEIAEEVLTVSPVLHGRSCRPVTPKYIFKSQIGLEKSSGTDTRNRDLIRLLEIADDSKEVDGALVGLGLLHAHSPSYTGDLAGN